MTELDVLKKIFLLPIMGKIGQVKGSLNVHENLVINFFLSSVYNGSVY